MNHAIKTASPRSNTLSVSAPKKRKKRRLVPRKVRSDGNLADHYDVSDKVAGKGSFGVVTFGTAREGKQEVALKTVGAPDSPARRRVRREARILTHPKVQSCPSLMHSEAIFQQGRKQATFVMPALPRDLEKALGPGIHYPEPRLRGYAAQLVLALETLHGEGIVHRDVKRANVLLAKGNRQVCLTDYGLSRRKRMVRGSPGSIETMAPEIFKLARKKEKYDGGAADRWSLGVVIFEMACGQHPFDPSGRLPAKALGSRICGGDILWPHPYDVLPSPELKSLIQGLLTLDPTQRIDFPAIKAHPFFKGVDWDSVVPNDASDPRLTASA